MHPARCSLADVARSATGGYPDLPIEFALDLGTQVTLSTDAAVAVAGAVVTLLDNIRAHANASTVVIHADASNAEREWELSVRDDGCGFDAARHPPGFGILMYVHQALGECGLAAYMQSEPGEGTVWIIRGPLPSSAVMTPTDTYRY